MSYTTSDFLSDAGFIAKLAFNLTKKISRKLKPLLNKLIEIEYDSYLIRILDNLPYGALIIYLGFLSVFTLFRITEQQNGFRVIPIATNSMAPTIAPGSLVITQKTNFYKKGDIVTFVELSPTTKEETGRTLTHRIIDNNSIKNSFITKGDSNPNPDPVPVSQENILGKVSHVIAFMGYFDLAIRTIPGFIIFVLMPCLILIKSEMSYIKSTSGRLF